MDNLKDRTGIIVANVLFLCLALFYLTWFVLIVAACIALVAFLVL